MKKFKEVKRKEIIYSLSEWKQIEKATAKVSMQTSEYIRRMSLDGKVVHLEMEGVTPVINAMRIMGNNINQIDKKANEINSIYADDVEKIKKIQEELCHILNLYVSTLPVKKRTSSFQHSLHIKSRKDGGHTLHGFS